MRLRLVLSIFFLLLLASAIGVHSLLVDLPSLDRLTENHPAVAAALLHATTQAIAAEYRWLAAENLALSR